MMTAKGIFSSTGTASFSKLRRAFSKIPKADFRKICTDTMCVVTSATMSHDNMLQWVIRGQVNGHRTGLGRPDPFTAALPRVPRSLREATDAPATIHSSRNNMDQLYPPLRSGIRSSRTSRKSDTSSMKLSTRLAADSSFSKSLLCRMGTTALRSMVMVSLLL